MTLFPKIFCLTLKDTPKRKEYAKKHFEIHGLDVEFFEGINNHKFGLVTTIPYLDDIPNWKPGDYEFYISKGQIGCLLSHYMLWKTLSHLPYEEIIIVEDDVILCDDFKNKFQSFKSQLPNDWQYVFIGYCCLAGNEYQIKVSDNIITTTHAPMCTHAYMIKKSSIETLLDTNHHAWTAVDIQIHKKSLKKLKHYVFIPPLADQVSTNTTDSNFFSLTS